MLSRKEALALARRYRTCPPAAVLRDSAHREQVRRHLEICPHCAAAPPAARAAWDELARQVELQVPPAGETNGGITAGSICGLQAELARWRDGFYYNPLAVLVMEPIEAPGKAFLVVQLYHDTLLAAPGDLVFSPGASGGSAMLAECWNRYTLPAGYLIPFMRAPEPVLEAVRKLIADPQDYPPWAPLPRPMATHDPRIAFRRLEVEAGYTFAAAGAQEILSAASDPLRLLDSTGMAALQADIEKLRAGVHWPAQARNAAELLTRMRFAADDLPLAAADEAGESLWAAWVHIRNGRVAGVHPLRARIFSRAVEDAEMVISGRVEQVPGCPQVPRLLACLERDAAPPLWPRHTHWRRGEFLLRFDAHNAARARLKLTVLCSTGETL